MFVQTISKTCVLALDIICISGWNHTQRVEIHFERAVHPAFSRDFLKDVHYTNDKGF
jgi:hypothetical protein